MALHFARDFRRQAAFQIFADQSNGSLASHAHGGSPGAEQPLNEHAASQNCASDTVFCKRNLISYLYRFEGTGSRRQVAASVRNFSSRESFLPIRNAARLGTHKVE